MTPVSVCQLGNRPLVNQSWAALFFSYSFRTFSTSLINLSSISVLMPGQKREIVLEDTFFCLSCIILYISFPLYISIPATAGLILYVYKTSNILLCVSIPAVSGAYIIQYRSFITLALYLNPRNYGAIIMVIIQTSLNIGYLNPRNYGAIIILALFLKFLTQYLNPRKSGATIIVRHRQLPMSSYLNPLNDDVILRTILCIRASKDLIFQCDSIASDSHRILRFAKVRSLDEVTRGALRGMTLGRSQFPQIRGFYYNKIIEKCLKNVSQSPQIRGFYYSEWSDYESDKSITIPSNQGLLSYERQALCFTIRISIPSNQGLLLF